VTDGERKEGPSISDLRRLHHQTPRWVIILLVIGLAAVVASHIPHLLMMLMAAAVVSYIFSSVVSALERRGIKRSIAVVLIFVVFALFVVSVDLFFAPKLKQEMVNAYKRLPEFSRIESTILASVEKSAGDYPTVEANIKKLVSGVFGPGGVLERSLDVSGILSQLTPFIMGIVLVPFFVFFLLKDWPNILRTVMDWVPPAYVETSISVVTEIDILVGKYLRGLAADCFCVGVLASLGLWLIGINYPILLGLVSGVANVVPYLGPITGCLASCLVALTQFNNFDSVLNVLLLYLAIKLMDDLVIQPLMIGKSVELHPMLLVITIIVGEKLFGISGMILGVPVVTAAQKTAGILIEHRSETLRRERSLCAVRARPEKLPVRPL
jgi:predicted PurR-regulated permease PerM